MEIKNDYGKVITPAQYIANMIIKRRAEHDKKVLPSSYYKVEPWKSIYKLTIIKANSLLKLYSAEAIIRALTEEGKNIWSLNASWLDDIIEKKQREIDSKQNKKEYNVAPTDAQPQKSFSKNLLGKLNG